MRLGLVVVAALVSAVVSNSVSSAPATAAPASPNAALLAAIRARNQPSRQLLERVVAIDSGTGDADGLNAVGVIYASELKGLAAHVRTVAPIAPICGSPRRCRASAEFCGAHAA
jgi:glutamate carboxypeptidase